MRLTVTNRKSISDDLSIYDFLAKNTVEGYNTSNCIYKLLKEKEIKIPMINLIHRIVMKKCEAKKILTFLIEKD